MSALSKTNRIARHVRMSIAGKTVNVTGGFRFPHGPSGVPFGCYVELRQYNSPDYIGKVTELHADGTFTVEWTDPAKTVSKMSYDDVMVVKEPNGLDVMLGMLP